MSLLKPAFLGLCLCGIAFAQPVRFEDEQTGFTWITDKQAGQQVILSTRRLVFLNANGRNWRVEIPEDDGWFSSALWESDGIYVSVRQGKNSGNMLIRKYSKTGWLLWEHDTDYGPSGILEQIWPEANLLSYQMHGVDAMSLTKYGLLNTTDGKRLDFDLEGGIVALEGENLLLRWAGPNFITEEFNTYFYKEFKSQMSRMEYTAKTLDGEVILENFPTPPRGKCGDFAPSIDEMWDMPAGQFKNESYRDYLSDDVRGEYIYAHRADECGKFTYKFHWTDPKNPAPEILDGWQ